MGNKKTVFASYKKKGPQGKRMTGKWKLYKSLPKGCKVAKRVCIKCLVTVIHKNDLNYDSKICKGCV